MTIETKKKSIAEETAKLQAIKEENQMIESKISAAQTKLTSLTKEMEDLKNHKGSSDKENVGEK